MDLAVLLKAVPEGESLALDASHRRIDRTLSPLRLNPFDARALQVARTLRRPGETITALCMGPPPAEVVLREALAAGVDRAILVSDPGLVGSDAQVTARVLHRALAAIDPGLVLLGARSSDAETGQVPPELAGLLGWPLVASARSVQRSETGGSFEITADGREGWVRWTVESPLVLSTGEKVAKPPRPTDEERAAAAVRPIEAWDLASLALAAADVGLLGSPTEVTGVRAAAARRHPLIFQEGTIPTRVGAAFDALAALSPVREHPPDLRTLPPKGGSPRRVWVVATNEVGGLDAAALPLIGAAHRAWPGAEITVVVARRSDGPDLPMLGSAGAQIVRALPWSADPPSASDLARTLADLSGSTSAPEVALLVADPYGREVAGRWAARSHLGLIGDATGFGWAPDGSVQWSKPAFSGGFEALIAGRTTPTLATVRPGVFQFDPLVPSPLPLLRDGPAVEALDRASRAVTRGDESDPRFGDLEGAERVVTVGVGIGGPDGIERLVPYLARWGASLGATRRVVDAGWLPVHRQVGLTGRSLAPALAVLLGVGKAQHHLVGLQRAGRVLAVNSDPQAPVFQYVDAGVVGGWEDALPALDERLTRPGPSRPPAPG
jgi:electron transfer flavoprotein alpha subunit